MDIDEALQHVAPNITDEDARRASAQRIVDGVTANEVYWASRGPLEALRARVEGHGTVQRGSDAEGEATDVGTLTATSESAGALTTPADTTAPAGGAPVPTPDNPTEAVARLREQLRDANIEPVV